jgi:hypothetical protein
MEWGFGFIVFIIAVALAFDFTNGMHDAANSVATIVSTRVLSPKRAVIWAAFFNFVAFLIFGTAVAKTIGKASIALNTLIKELFKNQKYTDSIWKLICEIHNLEDEGDLVYHRELRNLLNGEKDPILVIKWKDILTNLERIMDVYQNISNTVEGIIVKSS